MPRRDIRKRIDEKLKALRGRLAKKAVLSQKEAWRACRNDPSVRAACEFAGLDRKNPTHLAELLNAFASARFSQGKGGRPKKWDSFSWTQLLMSYLRQRAKNPELKDEAVCEELRKKPLYEKYSATRLVRILQDASDPNMNKLLRHALAMMPEEVLVAADKHRRHGLLPRWCELPDHWDKLKKRSG